MNTYIALLVWLGTDGPGPLSLDRLIARVTQRHSDEPIAVAPSVRRATV